MKIDRYFGCSNQTSIQYTKCSMHLFIQILWNVEESGHLRVLVTALDTVIM